MNLLAERSAERLRRLRKKLDLAPTEETNSWETAWPTGYNALGDSEDKTRYYSRDWTWMCKNRPQAVEALTNNRTVLRPFYESHGYADLPWYG